MSRSQRDLQDFFARPAYSPWERLPASVLATWEIFGTRDVRVNQRDELMAWAIMRSKPSDDRFKGNFPVCCITLRWLVKLQEREGMRAYVLLVEDGDVHEYIVADRADRVLEAFEPYAPYTNPQDRNQYWWSGEDLQPNLRVHKSRMLTDVPAWLRPPRDRDRDREWHDRPRDDRPVETDARGLRDRFDRRR